MKTCCSALLLTSTLLFTQPGNAKVNIESQVVGPANLGGVYTISQRGVRVAYVATKGSRLVVSIDGVEGPLFDELYGPHGNSFFSPPAPRPAVMTATPGGQTASTMTPVIFSDNGKHYAYAGRQGAEYVVIHDGKEIARGPRETLALDYGNLTLSPGGQYVYWDEMTRGTSRASWRLMMNGKPGPWSGHQTMLPTFSPDDQHYTYTYVHKDDPQQRIMIVDGKEAGYLADKPVWTADSKLLLTIGTINYKPTLLIKGKAAPNGQGVRKVIPAPVGSRYAAIVHARTENNRGIDVLYLDGKEVSGTEGARDAWFSPDGKRYTVACENTAARSMFMVVDGKKGLEYQGVSTQAPFWTADSSKLIYTAVSGGRNFVIVEGQEFAITGLAGGQVVTPTRGNRYAFATVDGANRNHAVILDGESVLVPYCAPMHLSFSDDGSRFTYAVRPIMNNQIAGLVVDGKLENQLGPIEFYNWSFKRSVPWYLFSPDGAHLARVGSTADPATQGLYVDGKLVYPSQRPIGNPAFTADGKHLYWLASVTGSRPGQFFTLYVDGEAAVELTGSDFLNAGGSWEVGSDGVLSFLAVAGDEVIRYRITPSPQSSVAKMVSEADVRRAEAVTAAQANQQQAAEAAAASRAQAAADAKAAEAKRIADYNAAREAALAKRQADYEAAVAAKKAAAEAARNKRLLQLENMRRARQGLPPLTELP